MWIDAIELRNIKSYSDEEISFRHGVNGISGANGAGKTTILEGIGFALFDNLQYSQKHFLRKGAKSGDVRIHVTAADGMEYTISRSIKGDYRVGSPVGDLAVGKIDVQDWIVENLFGGAINSGDLSSIFENAVGVPQGTFTTSFLSTPTVRKKVFDSILRVDEYRTAFENLNDVSKIIKNEIDHLEKKHHELKGRTSNYGELKERFGRERSRVSKIQEDLAELTKRLEQLGLKKDDLGKKKELIDSTGKEIEKLERDIEELGKHLVTAKKQLGEALDAKKVLEETTDAKVEYLESQKKLKDLDCEKHKRNRLNEQRLKQESAIQQIEQELEKKKNLSEELEKNRKKLREIAPLVMEQQELFRELRSIEERARDIVSLKSKISDLEREKKSFDEFSKDRSRLEKEQVAIEPLVTEQQELVKGIRSIEDQTKDVVSLKSDIGDLEKKHGMFESLSKDLGRIEKEQREIEPLVNRAEELEREKQDMKVKKTSAQEKMKGIRKNKRETGDTNRCPILEGVTCGAVTSFSDYFEEKLNESEKELGALKDELTKIEKEIKELEKPEKRMELNNSEISRINGQLTFLAGVADRLQQCRDRMQEQDRAFSGEYVSYLANLPETAELEEKMKQTKTAIEERLKTLDNPEKRMGLNNSELSRINGQLTLLEGVADRLQQCRDRMQEQDRAFSREYVSYLANLPETAELEEKMKQTETAMEERLKALDNPEQQASNIGTLTNAITGELNRIKTSDDDIKRENSRLFDIKLGLSEFSDLDSREAEIRKRLHDCEPHYMRYLQNEKNAGTVDTRRSRCDEVNAGIAEKKMENDRLSKTLAEHAATFDEEEYERIKKEYEARKIGSGSKKTEYDVISKNLKRLEKDLDRTESLIKEKERLKRECGSKREFLNYTEFIRSTLKDSAQLIAGKLIKSIGDEANRIYCEIINDYTQELRWTHDYAITITEHGEEKEFNQLSGGEQMGASLAVRFALLKILSGCDVVFLDEPTQNMDETRREKLSEQILNISGFKQIFVISHDDTFNEKYENVIRVEKINGESRIMDGDLIS